MYFDVRFHGKHIEKALFHFFAVGWRFFGDTCPPVLKSINSLSSILKVLYVCLKIQCAYRITYLGIEVNILVFSQIRSPPPPNVSSAIVLVI